MKLNSLKDLNKNLILKQPNKITFQKVLIKQCFTPTQKKKQAYPKILIKKIIIYTTEIL